MQRPAVSVSANIAEGACRDSTKEYLRFIAISLGLLAELQTFLQIVRGLNYVNNAELEPIESASDSIARILRSMQRSLRLRMKRQNPDL